MASRRSPRPLPRVSARGRSVALIGAAGLLAVVLVVVAIVVFAARPGAPARLALTGDLTAHDPALVAGETGHPWFVFSTGTAAYDGNIQVRESPDGLAWTDVGPVFRTKPAWLAAAVPGVGPLWAPDVHRHGGTWYLYYAASTFGSNLSVIALATNTTLDPSDPTYRWVDRGPVIASLHSDDFNAIDPNVVEDATGRPWLVFGSFWSGIRMVPLRYPDGMRADDAEPLRIANRGTAEDAIEAPFIVRHGGWYYLFASFDHCCQGAASTYNTNVGRSREVAGPYVDKRGTPLLLGGGSRLLSSRGDEIGPGGESVSGDWLAYHFYDRAQGGAITLAIRGLGWDARGWPTVG